MRVALLTPAYWPEVRRGTERVVHDLGVGLHRRGHTPRIVTTHPGRPSTATEEGVRVTRHWRPPHRPAARLGFPQHTSQMPLLAADLLVHRQDVAQAFFPGDAVAAGAWSRVTRRPSVFSIMGLPRARALRRHRRSLGLWQRACRDATAVVALSQAAREAVGRELDVDAHVIHPGVDLERFRPGAARSEHPTILCVGALDDPRKRVSLLVEAFGVLRRQRPTARLLLLQPSDPSLAAQFAADGVEFVDLDPRAEGLRELYGSAWVSALASEKEAFGLVLTEALACGTPVVGAADGAAPEIIGDSGVGATFAEPDAESVATALLAALECAGDPSIVASCRRRAEMFSVARALDLHETLYQELVRA
ncbi:glycosyltransferase family 4 protein [Paraconexibacter sp.]|uniref:glycosyltransferase family 4 protein n=1 Tax=Paraconexibacter sp. TaxID=2949640 RepID=UPI003564CE49